MFAAALAAGPLASPAAASESFAALAALGQQLLEKSCSGCHATGKTGDSPKPQAPPFRDLSKRFPVEGLAEALAEGIVTGHADMPEFVFQPIEIDGIIAYLETIQVEEPAAASTP